ncbi:MAG: hypothetical protein QNJ54_05445 [Prochloraceae cyanobacterium]|nr:hypothetical protein [Prochloraceae cyanobacterium]
MLYLAQVKKNIISGDIELELLARQKSEHIWKVSESKFIPLNQEKSLNEGLLVLAELDDNAQIIKIKEAKKWILSLVTEYLSNNSITPEFVQKEQERVEKWRQEIALTSQDLTRRSLEIETHREQLQELEENLMREKEKLASKIKEVQQEEEDDLN